MIRPKKTIRKKVVQEDSVLSAYNRVIGFYEDYKKIINIGVVALAVVVIGTVIFNKNQAANNEKATAELGQIFSYYDSNQFNLAIEGLPEKNIAGLKSIVDHYGSTSGGELARFYLANAYFQLDKVDEALEMFKDFSPNHPLLSVSRLNGIAGCYEAKQNYAEAAKYYEKAASENAKDVNVASNLNSAAMNYSRAGEKAKALDLFKQLKKEHSLSSHAREADRFITELSL